MRRRLPSIGDRVVFDSLHGLHPSICDVAMRHVESGIVQYVRDDFIAFRTDQGVLFVVPRGLIAYAEATA